MAMLEDTLQYLSPDLIEKIKQNPSLIKAGVLNVIKNVDPIEAANFITKTVEKEMFSQDNFSPTGESGIFGMPQDNPMIEGVKRAGTNAALNYANVPGAINYDTIGSVTDSFQQGGAGEAADTIINIAKDRGVEAALQYATGIGLPLQVASQILNSSFLAPVTGPFKKNANTMFSNLTFGQGPKLYDAITNPFNFFGGTSGIFNNQQNVVDVEEPVQQPVVQQPSVIDDYIASLGQSNTTQGDDGSQTISGGTTNPADDIVVTNLPKPIFRPTMADVAGPSSNNNFTPSRPNTPPPGYSPKRRTEPDLTNRATGGLVSVSRYLKGR